MNRKLWLLNLVLIAAIAAGVWRVRNEARDFQARKAGVLRTKVPVPAPPQAPPAAPSQAVAATSYLEIAQKMLWAKDRNSQVIVEPPKPPEPPKPLPALPSVHGVMNLGDGPIVMMSDKPGSRHRGIHPGEKIGEFKLVSVDADELVLAWENRTVTKKLQDLIDRGQDSGTGGTGGQGASSVGFAPGYGPPPPPPPPAPPEPGVKLTENTSSCNPGDPSPAGTIVNGMRKVVMQTPFGPACRWEAVK